MDPSVLTLTSLLSPTSRGKCSHHPVEFHDLICLSLTFSKTPNLCDFFSLFQHIATLTHTVILYNLLFMTYRVFSLGTVSPIRTNNLSLPLHYHKHREQHLACDSIGSEHYLIKYPTKSPTKISVQVGQSASLPEDIRP